MPGFGEKGPFLPSYSTLEAWNRQGAAWGGFPIPWEMLLVKRVGVGCLLFWIGATDQRLGCS